MSNPYVREIGRTYDINEARVVVGVDYDSVTICGHALGRDQCEEFAKAFVAACWEAADNSRLMQEEASS